MSSPAPRAPYARLGGVTSRRRPPTRIPSKPSSQARMTLFVPSVTVTSPESNCLPFGSHPAYRTTALLPRTATAPVPVSRSCTYTPAARFVIAPRSTPSDDANTVRSTSPAMAVGCLVGCVVGCAVGCGVVDTDDDPPPHADTPASSTTSDARRNAGLNFMSHSRLDITRHDRR